MAGKSRRTRRRVGAHPQLSWRGWRVTWLFPCEIIQVNMVTVAEHFFPFKNLLF
jgi:hypothetical protein